MDEKTALRFVGALRKEIEAITLEARVCYESGIVLPNSGEELYESEDNLNISVNIVNLWRWPASSDNSHTCAFAFAAVPVNNPMLSPLSGRPILWQEILRLPQIICRLAAEVLDGQIFKVRLAASDEELAVVIVDSDRCDTSSDDLWDWNVYGVVRHLEAWNENGAIKLELMENELGLIFTEEILDRLWLAITPK